MSADTLIDSVEAFGLELAGNTFPFSTYRSCSFLQEYLALSSYT